MPQRGVVTSADTRPMSQEAPPRVLVVWQTCIRSVGRCPRLCLCACLDAFDVSLSELRCGEGWHLGAVVGAAGCLALADTVSVGGYMQAP
jgi:hypothetical protein